MATESRPQDPDLIESDPETAEILTPGAEVIRELRKTPWEFEFFQAVRLIERFGSGEPIGRFTNPEQEAVRFTANANLAFPASRIAALDWPEGQRPEMTVNFLGLTGPAGVLPLAYSEYLNDRLRAKDPSLRAFLNIFNSRSVALFYAAWEKYRFSVTYERERADRLTQYLLDFLGLGTEGLQGRQNIPDESLIYYAGLFALQPRSATALRQIVSDYFEVPAEIEQFVGSWHKLAEADQCAVGEQQPFSEQLGLGAIVGEEIWDQQSSARIVLGPLTLDQYLDFLPNGSAFEPLQTLVRFFCHNESDMEVRLVLRREDVPALQLGAEASRPMLGWTTWVKNQGFSRDPGDTVLELQ